MKSAPWIQPLVAAFALLCMSACSAPSIRQVDQFQSEHGVPMTRFTFDSGAGLAVVADQGVASYVLEPTEGGFLLTWQGLEKQSWTRTLKPEGKIGLRIVELEVVTGPQAFYAMILRGDGGTKRLASEVDLRSEYGRNSLAYLGVLMSNNKVTGTFKGSPAESAGVLPKDKLTALEAGGVRFPLKNRLYLGDLLWRLRPGEQVVVVVERGGKELKLKATLGTRPLEAWSKTDG